MKVFSQQSWDLKNESCEIWREPSATYRVTSWYLPFSKHLRHNVILSSTKLFKTLRPLQREVQRDPPKKGRRIVFQSDLNLIAVEGFPLNWQCLWGMSPVSTSQRPKKHAVASFMPIISWCQNWTLLTSQNVWNLSDDLDRGQGFFIHVQPFLIYQPTSTEFVNKFMTRVYFGIIFIVTCVNPAKLIIISHPISKISSTSNSYGSDRFLQKNAQSSNKPPSTYSFWSMLQPILYPFRILPGTRWVPVPVFSFRKVVTPTTLQVPPQFRRAIYRSDNTTPFFSLLGNPPPCRAVNHQYYLGPAKTQLKHPVKFPWRLIFMGVSKNRSTPKWMVYNGKPH